MPTKIEDNTIKGTEYRNSQFLNGGPDVGHYNVKILMDGTTIETLVKAAIDSAIIRLRKRIKTKAQAQALAEGISFESMMAAQPRSATAQVAAIDVTKVDVDALPDSVRQAWIEKLMEGRVGDNTDQVVGETD